MSDAQAAEVEEEPRPDDEPIDKEPESVPLAKSLWLTPGDYATVFGGLFLALVISYFVGTNLGWHLLLFFLSFMGAAILYGVLADRRVRAARTQAQAWEGDILLEAAGITKAFGGLLATDDVSFDIPRKSIVSIIGPNGAGKTTFFNMLTGLYKPTAGKIAYAGVDTTSGRPDLILSLGVARTFQNIRLFATMTAVENVMVGQHARMKASLWGSILRPPSVRREEREVREKARELLAYVGLQPQNFDQLAVNLAYGDQRRVEIARALASDPLLLLLDEPTAGMNPQESAQLTDFMRRLRDDRGLTILLIEHDMKVVMGVSERITVLDHGQKIAEGKPEEVRANERVVEAYLGKPK